MSALRIGLVLVAALTATVASAGCVELDARFSGRAPEGECSAGVGGSSAGVACEVEENSSESGGHVRFSG